MEALKSDALNDEKKSLASLLQKAGATEEEAIMGVNNLLQGAVDTVSVFYTVKLYGYEHKA